MPENKQVKLYVETARLQADALTDLFVALDDLATWTHALAVHGSAPPSAWRLLDKLHAQADAALNKAQGISND
jgi:hypothetical protein